MKLTSHDIIRKPVITEKSMAAMAENKYTFIVHMAANKVQIKRAVEEVFNVKVADVKTMRFEGKTKRECNNKKQVLVEGQISYKKEGQ